MFIPMKINLLVFALLLGFQASYAQYIQSSQDSLLFPSTFVGDRDSLQINLLNSSAFNLQITNVKFYTVYGNYPFDVSQTSFALPAGGSIQLWIYFEPEHNIFYNSELVIQHTGNNGSNGTKSIDLRGQGVFSNTYYSTTQNLEEQALKNALKARLGLGYNQQSYNGARDVMFMTIDNKRLNGQGASVNTLECIYTGYHKTSYTSRSDAQTTTPQFNTEHTFPQGFFNQTLPERSDLHHLFPTTNNSNSQRGNNPFGVVTNGTAVTLGGGSFYNSTTFEPRNQQKGKTARAMLYFVIRYQDYQNHFSPQENLLVNWHTTYPPDSIEEQRNNDVFAVQNNRNPFIDYPQLAERITNFAGNSVAPVINGIDITQTSIDFGSFLAQQNDTLEFIIVNRGNQTITFSNFNLSNTSILSFPTGFANSKSILPGDALVIPVIANTTSTLNFVESLTFNTSLPGSQSSFTIPVRGNTFVVSLDEFEGSEQVLIYPIPMEEQLNLQNLGTGQKSLRLFDSKGALLYEETTSAAQFQIATQHLAKGHYFLEIISTTEKEVYPLQK